MSATAAMPADALELGCVSRCEGMALAKEGVQVASDIDAQAGLHVCDSSARYRACVTPDARDAQFVVDARERPARQPMDAAVDDMLDEIALGWGARLKARTAGAREGATHSSFAIPPSSSVGGERSALC